MHNEHFVTVENVSLAFSDEPVLQDVNLSLPSQQLTVLLGPSGCGKTSLVRLIAGYDQPNSGRIRVDGEDVTGPSAERIVVFQETALFPWMNLLDNVAFGPIQRGVSAREAKDQALEMLAKVGLTGFEQRYSHQISGGMQRRAELARALINKPKLLLLDEPFRGLDHMTRGLMQEFLLELLAADPITVLFVTSEVDEAVFLADRAVVMSRKPSRVSEVLDVNLPKPRHHDMALRQDWQDIEAHLVAELTAQYSEGLSKG